MKNTRGEKNNNPGNLRKTNDRWQGLSADQPDADFFTFDSAKFGVRALARVLIKHQDDLDRGGVTVRELISHYAPASENNTEAYINNVCLWTHFSSIDDIDVTKYEILFPLVSAIIREENGEQPYDKATLDEGIKLAGVAPPVGSALKSPAYTVGGLTAISAAITPLSNSISDAATSLSPVYPLLTSLVHKAPWAIGAALLGGAGWLTYHEWQKRKVQS